MLHRASHTTATDPAHRNDTAERRLARVERLYQALNSTIEAIMRAPTHADLYRSVCDASVHGSTFVAVSVFLHDPGEGRLRAVASTGRCAEAVSSAYISTDESLPEGRGVVGEAFRTHRPCIGNDVLGDERFRPWWERAREAQMRSVAALPLLHAQSCVGVLVYHSSEVGEFDDDMVALLQRVSANLSFALDRFAQEYERLRAEAATRRASRMYATLSVTNEAIMRVQTPQALYDAVCAAAVDGGGFRMAGVLVPDEDGWLRLASVAGVPSGVEQLAKARISTRPDVPQGQGTTGVAFRTRRTQVCNDYLGDERLRPWHELARAGGVCSNAAVPFMHGGEAAGVLLFFSHERDAFDGEIVGLLEHLGANVGFALEGFDREAERMLAQSRIEHLATHDGLTGLPNRAMFAELLTAALESAKRYDEHFALLFVDLDGFKRVNDTLGHAAGDELLRQISMRFRRTLRASDVIARLGGDEFVVLVRDTSLRRQAACVARKLLEVAKSPLLLQGREQEVSASIGIAMHPEDGADEQLLLRNADFAMYRVKQRGKNAFGFHS